jgi:hypothetical protein
MNFSRASMNVAKVNSGLNYARTNLSPKWLSSGPSLAPNFNMGNMSKGSSPFLNGWVVLGVVVLVAVLCYVYYQKVGYYIQLGWQNLQEMTSNGDSVDIQFGKNGGQVSVSKYDRPPTPNLPGVPNRPSGMPGAIPGQPGTFLSGVLPHAGKEVFNVSRNIYTYHDAAAVCAALDSELATYDQVQTAYKQGGDWCNYGWIQGQMAVYPTQQDTYDKLQKGYPQYHNACGKPGVNGGYFDDPELLFGVNCYGKKPSKSAMDELNMSQVALPPTTEQIAFEKRVQKFRDEMDNTTVLPFNKNSWSD